MNPKQKKNTTEAYGEMTITNHMTMKIRKWFS